MLPEDPPKAPVDKTPDAAPSARPEVDVSSIIENVEDQLEALKRAQTAQAESVSELTKKEQQLTDLEAQIREQAEAISKREQALETTRQSVEEKETELESVRKELAQRESDLEGVIETLDGAIAHATEKSEAIEKERTALEKERAELSEKTAAQDKKVEALKQELEQERDRLKGETAEQSKAVEELKAELTKAKSALDAATSELESASLERDSLRDECAKLKENAEKGAAELRALENQIEEAKQFADKARAEIASRDEQLQESLSKLKEAQEESASLSAESQEQIETLTKERDSLAELKAKLEQRVANLAAEGEQLRSQLEEAQATPAAKDARELNQLKSQLERAKEQVAEAKKAVERRDKQIKTLQQASLSGEGGADDEQVAELRGEVSRKDTLIKELETKAAEFDAQLAEAKKAAASGAAPDVDIQKRDKAIEVLKEKLEQTLEKNKLLREKLDAKPEVSAPAAAAPVSGVDPSLRRARLERYKSLLRAQSTKLVRAKEALQQRHQEFEGLDAKREEIAHASREIERKAKKIAGKSARNRASIAMLCLVVAIAICGALSWKVATYIAPGVYVYDAALSIQQEGDLELERADLDTWGEYMLELAADARLAEIASERMKRRGLLEFATPADLTTKLKQDLDVTIHKPGEITLSLKGDGAESTRRTLETFAASMMTVANDARSRRLDGATTALVKAPDANTRPVDSEHLMYTGAIWGGSSGLILAGFLFGWIYLARAKKKFEAEEALATYGGLA